MSALDQFFAGKVAVVTGAGSGIGRAIAQALAQHGARVHCADINAVAAETVAAGLRDAQAHTLDVSDADAVSALADTVYERDGRVDLLFNNAGVGHAALMVDTELSDWRRVIDINLMGVVHGVHAFLPRMLKQSTPSRIVNTASGAGLFPHPRMALYTAAKHAVVGLSTSLAAELENSKVGITVLCPGIINTAITQNILTSGETSAHRAQTIAFYEKNGASPEKVARDLLNDVRRNKLFCLSPRMQVGVGWLLYRLSPRLAIAVMRGQIKKVMGTDN
jgi:NAD(P)-dependent dehydrogenase (short-subunit alcohol dehydrogenase family)